MPASITSIAGEVAAAVQRVDALGGGPTMAGKLHGINERIAATESLLYMAEELRAGKAEIIAALGKQATLTPDQMKVHRLWASCKHTDFPRPRFALSPLDLTLTPVSYT